MRVEEEFENVMLNIEMQIISVSNQDSKLTDWQVDKVFSAFLSKYKALSNGREVKEVTFNSPEKDLYLLIEGACDFFTGDSEEWGDGHFIIELDAEKVSYENMVAIFKRLRKSLNTWTKRGGSQGYIYYISQFIPLPSSKDDSENPVIDSYIDVGLKATKYLDEN